MNLTIPLPSWLPWAVLAASLVGNATGYLLLRRAWREDRRWRR